MDVAGGHYDVLYRLKVLDNSSSSTVATIKVTATRSGSTQTLASRNIAANEFNAADTWQVFTLPVDILEDDTDIKFIVEFTSGVTDLYCDWIRVRLSGLITTDVFETYGIKDITKFAAGLFSATSDHALAVFQDGFWRATDAARQKFADNFWSGSVALNKFADDFFTYAKIQDSFAAFKASLTALPTVDELCNATDGFLKNLPSLDTAGKLILTSSAIGTKAPDYATLTDYKLTNSDISSSADIEASKILISGSTHLSDWRHASDLTKIDVAHLLGDIAAERMSANVVAAIGDQALNVAAVTGNVPALDSSGKLILAAGNIAQKATDLSHLWDKTVKISHLTDVTDEFRNAVGRFGEAEDYDGAVGSDVADSTASGGYARKAESTDSSGVLVEFT